MLDDLSVFYHVSVQTIQFTCDGKVKINTRPPRTDEIRTLTKILFQLAPKYVIVAVRLLYSLYAEISYIDVIT